MDCRGSSSSVSSRVKFLESPRSPFRRSRRSLSPIDQSESKCVGSLREVNTHVSYEGLLDNTSIRPLVSEKDIHVPPAMRGKTTKNDKTASTDSSYTRETTLIELAHFPGYFSHHVTPLPHCLDTLQYMHMVTHAQRSLCNKPNQPVQNLLFKRVAENYVLLLSSMAPSHYHDVFFECYPEMLIQSVYSIYVHSFPNSWSSFDDSFKNDLCNTVFHWFTGTQRMPGKWKEWDYSKLEPKGSLRYVTNNDEPNHAKSKSFNIDQLIEEARSSKTKVLQSCNQQKPAHQSQIHTAVLGSHFSHAVLDIKCSSPLVGYYLRNQGALPATGFSLLLQHINIHKQPDKDCITFSEVIAKSKEHDKMVHTEFQKYYDILRAHMQKHQRQRQILSMEHSTYASILLSHRQEIRRLSNSLAFNILGTQTEKSRLEKISFAIKDSIIRLS